MCLEKFHPLVSCIYFIVMLVILAGSFNPAMAGIGLVTAIAAMLTRRQFKNIRMVMLIAIPTAVFTMLLQPLFSHNGITALFYINDAPITLETIVFGIVAWLLLVGACGWCLIMAEVFTQEKIMYLLGRISPGLALLLSMTLRLIPQLKKRYEEISTARVFLGARDKNMREGATRVATLTEWSLESSMETAQTMEARGYGARGRTSFHLFRFRKNDAVMLGIIVVLSGVGLTCIFTGCARVSFFPQINMSNVALGWQQLVMYTSYIALGIIGIIPPRRKKGAGRK